MYCCRPVPVSTTGNHQTTASVEDTGRAYTSVGGSVGTKRQQSGQLIKVILATPGRSINNLNPSHHLLDSR